MSSAQGVSTLIAGMLHPSALSPVERARHHALISQCLAVGFTSLAVAPFFLAFHGAPTFAQALIFLFGVGHLMAAMLVARTGRLVAGQVLCFTFVIGASLTLLFGVHAGIACALAWLVPAQIEAAQCGDRRVTTVCTGVTMVVFVGLIAASLSGEIATVALAPISTAALTAFAVVDTLFLVNGSVILVGLMQTNEARKSGRWKAIFEALGDAMIGFEANGSVNDVSRTCETLFAATKGDLIGRGLFDHVHVADRPAFLALIDDAARDGTAASATIRIRTWEEPVDTKAFHEPRHVWIEMRVSRLDGDAAAAERPDVVAVLRDVSIERQRDLDMDIARQTVEAVIRSKDNFLANMSHELRTPLNAIIGFSDMLASHTLRPSDAEKQRDYARIIHQSGQHLLGVVNAILDMSKIQSGTFSIIPEPFDVVAMMDLCCDMVSLKAREGEIAVVRDFPDTIEALVGDKRACKQIVINLLSNALKFTPRQGRVTLKIRPEGNTLVLVVSDTGIGIAADDLPRLGNPFYQAKSTLSRPYEGTGLGLSVVRGLVGLHGGSMVIESEVAKGTSVTIRLPLDCRIVKTATGNPKIETIARRPLDIPTRHEPRMKQSA